MRKLYGLMIAWGALLWACTNQSPALRSALNESGANRVELERALDHYRHSPADSQKLRAAIFLVENMPGHYSCSGEYMDAYRHRVDSAFPSISQSARSVICMIPANNEVLRRQLDRTYDLQTVTGDELIAHIDRAFQKWERAPWLENLSFADFCEYLLPYRLDTEPLSWPGDSIPLMLQVADPEFFIGTNALYTIGAMKNLTYGWINRINRWECTNLLIPDSHIGVYDFNCQDQAYYKLSCLRASGVPAALDFVPHWPDRDNRHYWTTIIDSRYQHGMFNEFQNPNAAKVFRKTYSRNPAPQPNGKDSIPAVLRSPFHRDITDLYINTCEVDVALPDAITDRPDHLYLAVFNERAWHPVWWAATQGRKARFGKMGTGVMYQPVYYHGAQQIPAGYPFSLTPNGVKREYMPDTTDLQTLRLTRKYPVPSLTNDWNTGFVGTTIEASNDSDFTHPDTLLVIDRAPGAFHIDRHTDLAGQYRYIRYTVPNGFQYLAELALYDELNTPLTPALMNVSKNGFSNPLSNAFDNDPLTYATVTAPFILDLGHPRQVSRIRYLCRNDANGIYPGQIYELFYMGPQGWVSLGSQRATGMSVEFPDVPANAVYWLRNWSEGKEERIFTCENEGIRFW